MGDVPDEQVLYLALALCRARSLGIELDYYVQGSGVGDLLVPALLCGVLGLLEVMIEEAEFKSPPGEVFDGGELLEELSQAVAFEPVEGVRLDLNQIGDIEDRGGCRI